MLPESYLCGKETENIRRLLKSREGTHKELVELNGTYRELYDTKSKRS